ncbi:MAG: T9SS type A sorting domain-containing protein [Chitinophagaceae bacterium]|nr:T9SS type A sorting domain-containing protein [Chitinophagaceae bacterium]MCB9046983.1 T9SS type A sorting domain-containing protein [Chitinophagales bacterium]
MKKALRRSSLMLICLLVAGLSNIQKANAQYCTPTFYYPCNWYYLYINSFSTTGGSTNITSNNTGCSNTSSYIYYNTRVHTGIQGQTVNFTLANTPYYSQAFRIWVDFNLDGDFLDAGEQVYAGTLGYGSSTTGSFTIPLTATPGNSRLRIRSTYQYASAPQPCGSAYYGECEDYGFVIVAACSTSFAKKIGPTTEVCENGAGTINVYATNGAGYQWQIMQGNSFVNLSNNATYHGVTTQTLSMSNIPSNLIGAKFRCLVTPTCGSTITNPSDTTMLIKHPDIKLVSQPLSDSSCQGLNTTITFKADDTVKAGRWQIYSKSAGGYVDVTMPAFMQNKDTLYAFNVSDTLNGALIRCVFDGVCGTATTNDIKMVINPIPVIVSDPVDQNLKPGGTAFFNVSATGIGVKYQWAVSDGTGNYANVNDNGIYSGSKTNILRVGKVSRIQDGFMFKCMIKGSGNCAGAADTSESALLSVEPMNSVNDITSDNNITIYPNPAKGEQVVIKTDKSISEYVSKYTITDKTGKTLSVGNLDANSNTTTINISKLSPDVYFITILDVEEQPVRSIKFTKLQ